MSISINIIGSIDEEQFSSFSEHISALLLSDGPIHLNITSEGGDDMIALAFAGRMRRSGLVFHTTVYGQCSSAATMILAYSDKAYMTKESWVMVHEGSHDSESVPTTGLERMARHQRAREDQWTTLLAENTTTSKERWDELHRQGDLYLTPAQCLELGLIDGVI